jgi:hypothetical protein
MAGGTVEIAGELSAGLTVVMEELVRGLSGGADPVSLFILMPPFAPERPPSVADGFSLAKVLRLALLAEAATPGQSLEWVWDSGAG